MSGKYKHAIIYAVLWCLLLISNISEVNSTDEEICFMCLEPVDQSIWQKYKTFIYDLWYIDPNPIISPHLITWCPIPIQSKYCLVHLTCIEHIIHFNPHYTCQKCLTDITTDVVAVRTRAPILRQLLDSLKNIINIIFFYNI
jgi:hypothetical protein